MWFFISLIFRGKRQKIWNIYARLHVMLSWALRGEWDLSDQLMVEDRRCQHRCSLVLSIRSYIIIDCIHIYVYMYIYRDHFQQFSCTDKTISSISCMADKEQGAHVCHVNPSFFPLISFFSFFLFSLNDRTRFLN